MKQRIRDFLFTKDGLVFSVVDYVPQEYYGGGEGVRAMLRYVPDEKGERMNKKRGIRYRKLGTGEAFEYMKLHHPGWVYDVFAVPYDEIQEYLRPEKELERVCQEDEKVSRLIDTLEDMGVRRKSMGITGSRLTSLSQANSDIDLVVYGKEWWRAREILSEVISTDQSRPNLKPIPEDVWQKIYKKRVPEIGFQEFLIHEVRKYNRAMWEDTYFDLLYVGEGEYKPPKYRRKVEKRTITGMVLSAKYAFDSPSVFEIEHPMVDRVLSYTHTYAGQVFEGEILEARGMLEETEKGIQLVVGTTREAKGEWIRSLTLLEGCK